MTRNNRKRRFRITHSNYGKEKQNGKSRKGRPQTKRELCAKETKYAKHGGTTKPKIRRTIEKRPRPNLDIPQRLRLCLRTSGTSTGNQQTRQLRSNWGKFEQILPIPKNILRPRRHTNYFPSEIK